MKFLMDIIMPPLKMTKPLDATNNNNNHNNSYFIPLPSTSNEHMQYITKDHSQKVLSNLNSLRMESRSCDVDIIAGDKVFKV